MYLKNERFGDLDVPLEKETEVHNLKAPYYRTNIPQPQAVYLVEGIEVVYPLNEIVSDARTLLQTNSRDLIVFSNAEIETLENLMNDVTTFADDGDTGSESRGQYLLAQKILTVLEERKLQR